MSDSRSRILSRLRQADSPQGSGHPRIPVRRFDWDTGDCRVRFCERLESVRGEVHLVGEDWPGRLCELLTARGLSTLLHGAGTELARRVEAAWELAGGTASGWRPIPYDAPVESLRNTLFDGVEAGITSCRGAIAETGTLVLWPDREEPRLLSLVPPVHLVLLDAHAIRSTFAELLVQQGWESGLPSNALLITGPSKSADIEQTLTYGVHGPKELIVLVRTDSADA